MAGATHAVGSGALVERLEARRDEIEQTLLTRVYAVSDPEGVRDPGYALGLRSAVSAALSHGLYALREIEPVAAVPAELTVQARLAARNRVSLDVVLRRYVAGHALLDDFILQEAAPASGIQHSQVQRALRSQARLLDRLIAVVSSQYREELEAGSHSRQRRQIKCVTMLLEGELADSGELDYDLEPWHLGVVAFGSGAAEAIAALANAVDCRLLLVCPSEEMAWAWLGSRRKIEPKRVSQIAAANIPEDVLLAFGDPGRRLDGWRITHRQAAAALTVAQSGSQNPVCYADVCLLASILRDEVLVRSLHDRYIAPLTEERDGGESLRSTLRAYFAADRNSASASAALGVTRQTVHNRLRAVEERLDRPLSVCAAELEAALRLDEITNRRVVYERK